MFIATYVTPVPCVNHHYLIVRYLILGYKKDYQIVLERARHGALGKATFANNQIGCCVNSVSYVKHSE